MVRLSEMDSGSIVFAGRTGRGGKAARGATGVARGRVGGTSGTSDAEVGEWKVAMGGTGVVAMAGERPAFLREIFLRRVAESGR